LFKIAELRSKKKIAELRIIAKLVKLGVSLPKASFSASMLIHLHIVMAAHNRNRKDLTKKITIQNRVIPINGLLHSHFSVSKQKSTPPNQSTLWQV
jgi:hypothetical protein